ncbi:hypothetical protein [Actinomyces oris]|uniref:hypothetical protein n=1 Tax=Actinomyces oris TaxID=544580 RepID=UPI0022FD7345|nr:hypothetical protein [Actinomyces oris]WCA43362.1 hypothetical protein PGE45_03645 [Actinomyces oris]
MSSTSSTTSTTSPDDVGSTSTEATGEDATRPFPAAGDTQPLTPPVTQPVTMPLPASDKAGAETASAGSAPASSASSPVWSAGTVTEQDRPQAPQDIKGSTLLWGAFLLLVGGLLIAAGLGLRFDFTTTAIACLAGLGALLVVAALIPKRRRSAKKS